MKHTYYQLSNYLITLQISSNTLHHIGFAYECHDFGEGWAADVAGEGGADGMEDLGCLPVVALFEAGAQAVEDAECGLFVEEDDGGDFGEKVSEDGAG